MAHLLIDADSITYSVNKKSILDEIPNFHVANGQMPQDIMHILFKGVVPFEIKLMLKVFIYEKHYFNLDLLIPDYLVLYMGGMN